MKQISFLPYLPWDDLDLEFAGVRLFNFWKYGEYKIQDRSIYNTVKRIASLYRNRRGGTLDGFSVADYGMEQDWNPQTEENREHISNIGLALMYSTILNNSSLGAVSPENFIVYHQHFTPGMEGISYTFGSYVQTTNLASQMKNVIFTIPDHVPYPVVTRYDTQLFQALISTRSSIHIEEHRRIFESLAWIAQTFLNSDEYRHPNRIISLSTAFEILLQFPEKGKAQFLAKTIEKALHLNGFPKTTRQIGSKKKTTVEHTAAGWWCREFYSLRSRIVHGEKIHSSDFLCGTGTECLIVGLKLFDGFLRKKLSSLGYLKWNSFDEMFWRHDLEQFLDISPKHTT